MKNIKIQLLPITQFSRLICILLLFSVKAKSQIQTGSYWTTIGVTQYPTHLDSLGKGGYRVVKDITQRNAITCLRRKFGMAVYVQSESKLYILKDSACNNVWEEFTAGGGGGGGVDSVGDFGSFYSINAQYSYDDTSLVYGIQLSNTDTAKGFYISSNSIFCNKKGLYNLQFNGQLYNNGADGIVTIWLKKNDVNIPYSSRVINVPAEDVNNSQSIASLSYILPLDKNDYINFYVKYSSYGIRFEPSNAYGSLPSRPSIVANIIPLISGGGNAIDSIRRKVASDSVFGYINGVKVFQFKDSSGGAGTITKAVDSVYKVNNGDTIFVRYNNNTVISTLKIKDSIGVTDTANKYVNAIGKNTTRDSIIFFIGTKRYAIRDSIGGSSIDTTSLSNRINSKADTSLVKLKLNISDTSNMLSGYVRKSRTISTTLPLQGGGSLNGDLTLSMIQSGNGSNGWLSSSDWISFNGRAPSSRTISTTAPLTGGGDLSANRTIAIPRATASVNGYLHSTDFAAFAAKQPALNPSEPIKLSGSLLSISKASSTDSGYLSATDWNIFNNKLNASDTIKYIKYTNISNVYPMNIEQIGQILNFGIFQASPISDGYISSSDYNKFSNKVDTIYRTIGKDSIQFKINGRYYAIKDSSGGGGTVTKAVDSIYRKVGKDSIFFRYNDSTILKFKDSVGVSRIVAGTGISISPSGGTGQVTITSTNSGGTVTSVTAASPLSVTNSTTTPYIGIDQATTSQNGYLTATDWNTFNGKVSSVSASGLLTSTGGTSPTISSSMSANKLVGRNATTSGAFQEITLGSGLSMTGTTLSATGGGGGGSQNLQQVLDTGYTLNGNFYFQTNTSDSIVNLSGSLLTASRTYNFPDANGTIALVSDLTPPTYQIDLTSANYGMGTYGTYQIKVGTDSTTPYYISFPSASSNTGKRITLVNNDNTSFNNAIIDTSSNAPKYQGTGKTLWDIPYGMSYEFLSIDGKWMCTSPTPVYVDTFASDYDGTGITTYNIPFNGTYKIVNINSSKKDDYYIVTFPDPKKSNGERITLINADTIYSLKIEGTWIPISKNTYGGQIVRVAPQSTYEFASIDSQWVCVNMSTPPTYTNIDLTAADFEIPSCGVYFFSVTSATYSANLPANAEWYDGRQVILINNDGSTALDITGATNPDGTAYSSLASGGAATFVSIGGKWVIIAEK